MSHLITKQIEQLLNAYEPRAEVVQVMTRPNIDNNAYQVTISFYVVNHPEPVQIETMLERLR
jgi:predicted component of type VI protein secretion system